MSTSFFDVAINWFGGGANLPKVCVPFASPPQRTQRFGDANGDSVRDSLILTPPDGVKLRAPMNGLLWQVPALGANPLALPLEVLPCWPRLRRIDGSAFDARESPAVLAEFDLLLEVWPTAFRRLEYVFSSLEIPTGMDDWDLPQMPVPRWFWFRGLGPLGANAQAIADAQFQGTSLQPNLANFSAGKAGLYVAAGDSLIVCDGTTVEVRAFDSSGSVIDPDWVFQIFELIGSDSDFTRLRFEWPESTAPWNAPERHVIVVCDGGDKPFVSNPDPDSAELGLPSPVAPARELSLSTLSSQPSVPIPPHGVVVIDSAQTIYQDVADTFTLLELQGEHQRIALRPHGMLAKTPRASFGRHSFLRLQAVDFSRWFPVSANPRNQNAGADQFSRYTDGNEVLPLIDGRDTLRAIYRAWRATHVVEDYLSPDHVPALDPDAVPGIPDPVLKSRAKLLLTNAWIEPDATLLGRRAMLAAPRTQSDPVPDLPTLSSTFAIVGALSPPGEEDFAGTGSLTEYRLWWLVSTQPLPPGAFVAIRQLSYIERVRGDDPRLPDVDLTSDIYGLTTTLGQEATTSSAFVNQAGQCVIPVLFKNGEAATAHVRVVTFAPDADDPAPLTTASSGKGTKHIIGSGELLLPAPSDANSQPSFTPPTGTFLADELRIALEFDGVPGQAIVVVRVNANTPVAATPVLVVVARTGEVASATLSSTGIDGAELRVPIGSFALRDLVLVGFPPASTPDLQHCSVFFVVQVKPDQLMAGAALGHPTEVLGALQETMLAGVDTRLLVWRASDRPLTEAIFGSTGTVAALNAGVNGQRGQAMMDSLVRHEFGVHHQKSSFIQTARPTSEGYGAIAFVGGIDLMRNRWDTPRHDALEPDRQGSPFHDIHCRIRGRAAWDVYRNMRQRWNAALEQPDITGHDAGWQPLPATSDTTAFGTDPELTAELTLQTGDCTAQINRTLAPFVPEHAGFLDPDIGDLSILKSYRTAIAEARRFLFIQDQYFFNLEIAQQVHDALISRRIAFAILVLPRKFSDFSMGDLMTYAQRRRALSILFYGVREVPAGGTPPQDVSDRVVVVTPKNDLDEPVYVHCKVMVADDLWLSISSSNMSRRSMTYDGEIGVMAIDRRGARGGQLTARKFRVDLLSELLGLEPVERSLVEDPDDAFRLLQDYFAGRWAGRHFKLQRCAFDEMDTAYTHYGVQPTDVDGAFVDALNAIADPDGRRPPVLPLGLVDARIIMEALKGATPDQPFGGLGSLRIAFDASALGNPDDIVVTVSIKELPDDPAAEPTGLGSHPATSTVNAGIMQCASTYKILATAAFKTLPVNVIATKEQLSHPIGEVESFVSMVTLTF